MDEAPERMRLTVSGEEAEESPSPAVLEAVLAALAAGEESFVILGTSPQTYIQAARDAKGGFLLEVQSGGTESHERCTTPGLDASQVTLAFRRYLEGDGRWRTELQWERQELGAGTGCLSVLLPGLLAPWSFGT